MARLSKKKIVYREGQVDEKVEWLLLADGQVVGRFEDERAIDEAIAVGNSSYPT